MSLFIVFEGIDGSGKSTQVALLAEKLTSLSKPFIIIREPGGTPLGESIRKELKTNDQLSPITQLLLFSACRSELLKEVILPKLNEGLIVICDRYTYSTLAYQGYAEGIDIDTIKTVIQLSTDGFEPDIVLFLDTPVETARSRKGDNNPDHFDKKDLDFYTRTRDGYITVAMDKTNWNTIDGTEQPRMIANNIWKKIEPLI